MAKKFLSDIDMNTTGKITNLADPVSAQDGATKAYVDAAIEGTNWKDSCRVASQANVTVASPGASIDSITLVANDRVLLRAQTANTENGIYIFNGAATPMTRAADANTAAELEQAITAVEEGTSAGVSYRQTLVNFTLGSGAIAFTVFGGSTPVASTSQTGTVTIATQAEVNTGTDTLKVVTPETLTNWASRIKKYAALVGDASLSQIDVTHNIGSLDVLVQVYLVSTGEEVIVDNKRISTTVVRLNFSTAPALNAYKVVVVG